MPIPLAKGDGGSCDAYTALWRLETFDPVAPEARHATPLFRRGAKALLLGDVTAAVRAVACAAGEVASRVNQFSGRSLRIGGATELAAMRVPALTIQLLGRWDSEVYKAYTRVSRGEALRISAAMGGAANNYDPTLESLFNFTQSA